MTCNFIWVLFYSVDKDLKFEMIAYMPNWTSTVKFL